MLQICGKELTSNFSIKNPSVGHGREIASVLSKNSFFLKSLEIDTIIFKVTYQELFNSIAMNKTLKSLKLSHLVFTEINLGLFINMIKLNQSLERLILCKNSGLGLLENLFQTLQYKYNIQYLSIIKCEFTKKAQEELGKFLNREISITNLKLELDTKINEEILWKSLTDSKYLSSLDLNIQIVNFELLINYLKKNKLKNLILCTKGQPKFFIDNIFNSLMDNNTLISLKIIINSQIKIDGDKIGKFLENNNTLKSLIIENDGTIEEETKLIESLLGNFTLIETNLCSKTKFNNLIQQFIETNKKTCEILSHFSYDHNYNVSFHFY